MKTINIEDDVLKHCAIKRALNQNGISQITHATDGVTGIQKIEQAIAEGKPFQLLVVDMHFPKATGERSDSEAGIYVIKTLQEKGIQIPIIVCSSDRLRIGGVAGCVHYHPSRDLYSDMKEILEDL